MDQFAQYRKKHLTEFELRAYRNLHRAVVLEQRDGGASIDTHECPMCRPAGCSGNCEQGRRECDCHVGQSQMPSPLDPQPVQIAKPSMWKRLVAWWERFKARHWIGDEE